MAYWPNKTLGGLGYDQSEINPTDPFTTLNFFSGTIYGSGSQEALAQGNKANMSEWNSIDGLLYQEF